MSSTDSFVHMLDDVCAGRPRGDGTASDDPYVRMLEKARRQSEASDFVSIKKLAAELGKSVRTLRRWNKRPDAPQRFRRGRRLMYRRADLEPWLERILRSARAKAPADGEGL